MCIRDRDGTVAPAILLQLNKPCSGIGYFDFVNPLLSKALFRDNVDHRLITRFGIMTYPRLLQNIFSYKLENCHLDVYKRQGEGSINGRY